MSDETKSGGGGLAFIVGALVVVVAGLAYLVFGGSVPGADEADIKIDLSSDG